MEISLHFPCVDSDIDWTQKTWIRFNHLFHYLTSKFKWNAWVWLGFHFSVFQQQLEISLVETPWITPGFNWCVWVASVHLRNSDTHRPFRRGSDTLSLLIEVLCQNFDMSLERSWTNNWLDVLTITWNVQNMKLFFKDLMNLTIPLRHEWDMSENPHNLLSYLTLSCCECCSAKWHHSRSFGNLANIWTRYALFQEECKSWEVMGKERNMSWYYCYSHSGRIFKINTLVSWSKLLKRDFGLSLQIGRLSRQCP